MNVINKIKMKKYIILMLISISSYSQISLDFDNSQQIQVNNISFQGLRGIYNDESQLTVYFPGENFTIDKDLQYANSITYYSANTLINFVGTTNDNYDISRVTIKSINSSLLINGLLFKVGDDIRDVITVDTYSNQNGYLVFKNDSDEYYIVKYSTSTYLITEIGFKG